MVKLTVGTNTQSNDVIVPVTTTLSEAIKESKIVIGNAALHLNGQMIPGAALSSTLESLGVVDGTEAMLIAVIKADSAK